MIYKHQFEVASHSYKLVLSEQDAVHSVRLMYLRAYGISLTLIYSSSSILLSDHQTESPSNILKTPQTGNYLKLS